MRKAKQPTPFPATVVVDNREQRPYSFADILADVRDGGGPLLISTIRGTLKSGDYAIQGMENVAATERKSISDLFSTIGQGRARFERELHRLNEMKFAAVVVESDWREILESPPRHTKLKPKTIWRSVIAWQQRYTRVHWCFMPTRRHAEIMTLRILERAWKEQQGEETK